MRLPDLSRRDLLIGGGIGVGLVVAYQLWPRAEVPALNTAPGEHVLSGFVKIGEDGHVAIVVPQVELGHGVFTTLAQIVADEVGADWRQVSVESAVGGPAFANQVWAAEWREGLGHGTPRLTKPPLVMVTGGSSSVRAFEAVLRDAGAAARALLCAAAAARWDADWRACETYDGFVWRGDDRMRFGSIAVEASRLAVPSGVMWRTGREHRLTSVSLPRLDLPSKVDGSVTYAADIRLPDMVYAAIASPPAGSVAPRAFDARAARRVPGVIEIVDLNGQVAVAATNGWAAERGVAAARSRWTKTSEPNTLGIARALDTAFDGDGERIHASGDLAEAFRGASVWTQQYRVGLAVHASVETASATARVEGGLLELWLATQVPELARDAAARATGIALDRVVVHPTMVGGSFGARYEVEIAVQAALLAQKLKRPVQLTRSRAAETQVQPPRPPAAARMAARTGDDGRIEAWFAKIAAPATAHELNARIFEGADASTAMTTAAAKAEPAAVAGSVPPYDVAIYAIDHHPAAIGLATGDWRGRGHVASAFFRECFVDEIAHSVGGDPFGYRMAMLGGNPRLAQCLTRAAATGGWLGGTAGANQGLACHIMAGSHIAVMAEARLDAGRVRVTRLVAVADVGCVVNPDVVRAQIVGGLVFGMASATGAALDVRHGIVGPARLADLRLPRMADCPQIDVELIVSADDPGGAGEIAVPPVGPAIAGALFAATGVRYRQLPLTENR